MNCAKTSTFIGSAHVIVAISSDIVLKSVTVYFIAIPLGGVLIKFPSLSIDARGESVELTFLAKHIYNSTNGKLP
jgi:hypothetical protein